MFVSVFILLFSVGALVYWVRSAIVTVLDGERAVSEALCLAEANRLEFPMVRRALQSAANMAEYGRMAASLRFDFQALTYLLRFAATVNVGRYSSEERLLVADFHLMRIVYAIGGAFSPRVARYALSEMTVVLEHFASHMSSRMSTFAMDAVGA
jgi:hypothetical protein